VCVCVFVSVCVCVRVVSLERPVLLSGVVGIMVYSARCSGVTEEGKPSGQKPSQANCESPPEKTEREKNEKLDPIDWGYDLYPERRGEKYQPSWTKVLFRGEGKENFDKLRCEENVYNCVKNSM